MHSTFCFYLVECFWSLMWHLVCRAYHCKASHFLFNLPCYQIRNSDKNIHKTFSMLPFKSSHQAGSLIQTTTRHTHIIFAIIISPDIIYATLKLSLLGMTNKILHRIWNIYFYGFIDFCCILSSNSFWSYFENCFLKTQNSL